MIVEYHRPVRLDEALRLIARTDPVTIPLGGGSAIDRLSQDPVAVVDLQALGLNTITRRGNVLEVGAATTLQSLLETGDSSGDETPDRLVLPEAFYRVIRLEATHNLRQVATVAGTLLAADGRSPFATAFLGLHAQLFIEPEKTRVGLGDIYALRQVSLHGKLITRLEIPVNVRLAYEYVARTPADRPIVCVVVARWPSGRTRVIAGGFGNAPVLSLDGPEPGGSVEAVRNAYATADDQWASAEYRREVAAILVNRCLEQVGG
jgi:CO/xanthine dehydrogenase FAD-binding subunit